MRPKQQQKARHDDLFRARLNQIVNMKHELVVLADKIDWVWLDEQLAGYFPDEGRPAEPVCFMIGMFLLKHTLWDPKMMRIVVVQDLNLRIPHAILAVYVHDKIMLFDNQIAIVANSSKIHHYRPIFSVSETAWWRHTPNSKSRKKTIWRRRRPKRS